MTAFSIDQTYEHSPSAGGAAGHDSPETGLLRIITGWLVDGTGGPVRTGAVLHVVGGVIASVREDADEPPPGCRTLDLGAHTVFPALVDAHVHLAFSGTRDPALRKRQTAASYPELEPLMERRVLGHLSRGVAAVRDAGDRSGYALRYRKGPFKVSGPPFFLKAAGPAWRARGRYGRAIGRTPLPGMSLPDSIIRKGRRADHVKLLHSGLNSLESFGRETPPQFTPRELREAVRAALGLGLPTMVHANGRAPVATALEAGCSSIEHGFFMGEEALEYMARSGIVWVPTACTMRALAGMLPARSKEAAVAARNLEHQLDQIRKGLRAGVTMALGTDSGATGVDHGPSAAMELALFAETGMSAARAIQCAAWNGARLLGLEDRLGRLVRGMPATFAASPGPPDNLLRGEIRPEAVYIQGRALDDRLLTPPPGRSHMNGASP